MSTVRRNHIQLHQSSMWFSGLVDTVLLLYVHHLWLGWWNEDHVEWTAVTCILDIIVHGWVYTVLISKWSMILLNAALVVAGQESSWMTSLALCALCWASSSSVPSPSSCTSASAFCTVVSLAAPRSPSRYIRSTEKISSGIWGDTTNSNINIHPHLLMWCGSISCLGGWEGRENSH